MGKTGKRFILIAAAFLCLLVGCSKGEEGVNEAKEPSLCPLDGENEQDTISFQFADYLPYDQQYDIEITSLVQEWGGLKCMVAQITSDEERAEFNKTFSKYGVEIPNHNFEESFLLVSGEAEIGSISGNIDGEQKITDVLVTFDPESMPINNLALYVCEKAYLTEAIT